MCAPRLRPNEKHFHSDGEAMTPEDEISQACAAMLPLTDRQWRVWEVTFALHFERMSSAIDPRLAGDDRLAYLEKASKLAATRAYEAATHAPGLA